METDDPHGLVAGLVRAIAGGDAGRRAIAVSDRLTAIHLLAAPGGAAGRRPGARRPAVLRDLRMVKDADEIELLRLAGAAADRVVDQIAAGRLVGRTEADVAGEVRERLLAEGHELAEFAIVASGPELGVAAPRGIGAGHPGRRADRPRHRRRARRLRQRHRPGPCG